MMNKKEPVTVKTVGRYRVGDVCEMKAVRIRRKTVF